MHLVHHNLHFQQEKKFFFNPPQSPFNINAYHELFLCIFYEFGILSKSLIM